MKTLASLGATRKIIIVSGTTSDAWVELSEERGDISNGGDQWRRNRGGNTLHCGSCVWNHNDDGNIVVKRVGDPDSRDRLIVSDGSGSRGWGGWCLSLLSLNVGNYGGRQGNLRATTCLNQERLKTMDDVWSNKFSENTVSTVLKVLQRFFQSENGCTCSKVMSKASLSSGLAT